MNTPTNQQATTPYGNLNLEIRENRMYTLMREEVVNFICNVFITFADDELNNH